MILKVKIINNRYSRDKICLNNYSRHFKLTLSEGGYDIWYYLPTFKPDDIIEFDVTGSNNEYLLKNKEKHTFLKKYENGFYNSFRKTNLIKYKVNGKNRQKTLTEVIAKPTNVGRHIEEINEILDSEHSFETIKSDVRFDSYSKVLTNAKLKELLNLDLDEI